MKDILYNEDCVGKSGMCTIPDQSIDMILCDLPYGTTRCGWDSVIPFNELWQQYERVIKDNGAIVLTAAQPFTSLLIVSNLKLFRYDWVWKKVRVTGHLNAKKMPLREHESILVFYKKTPVYNAQMRPSRGHIRGPRGKVKRPNDTYDTFSDTPSRQYVSNEYYPRSVIEIASESTPIHPTQKPVSLFEYLIKTYTNEGEIVLDNCMGSGTTAIACINTMRRYIGYEKDKEYYMKSLSRIAAHKHKLFT